MKRFSPMCAALVAMIALGTAEPGLAAKKAETAGKTVTQKAESALKSPGGIRIGIGVNMGRIDGRVEITPRDAVGVFMDLDVGTGDSLYEDTQFMSGAYYMRRIIVPDPVGAHVMAGISANLQDNSGAETTDVTVFGGFGAEYFFPGTRQFSIEGNVGVGAHFQKYESGRTSTAGIDLRIDDLTGGLFMLRYYF